MPDLTPPSAALLPPAPALRERLAVALREVDLLRRLERAFLLRLLEHGPDTSDAVRGLVPIPAGTDPRVVGSAVRGLAEQVLITSVGRRKTRRGIAHARKLDVWQVTDMAKARRW